MKILVTGGGGQLAKALKRQRSEGGLVALSHSKLDITDPKQVRNAIEDEHPDVIVNCAAWTDVDGCEGNPDRAHLINGLGVENLLEESSKADCLLVQISSDYVFDGKKKDPYVEADTPNPLSAYGKSKLYAEELVGDSGLVIRTSWVMGPDGQNMLKTVLRLLEKNEPLAFVDDQIGCPTFADDLATVVLNLAVDRLSGLFHVTNATPVSWFTFAQEVAELSGRDPGLIRPIATTELEPPRLAPRPANSILANQELVNRGTPLLRCHKEALGETLQGISSNLL